MEAEDEISVKKVGRRKDAGKKRRLPRRERQKIRKMGDGAVGQRLKY